MNIHIITVSLVGNELVCMPDPCEVDVDGIFTLLVWRLDEATLKNGAFVDINDPSPGFQFDVPTPPGRFQFKNIDKTMQYISILNLHTKKPSQNKWKYTLRVTIAGQIYETGKGKGNHPVIINR